MLAGLGSFCLPTGAQKVVDSPGRQRRRSAASCALFGERACKITPRASQRSTPISLNDSAFQESVLQREPNLGIGVTRPVLRGRSGAECLSPCKSTSLCGECSSVWLSRQQVGFRLRFRKPTRSIKQFVAGNAPEQRGSRADASVSDLAICDLRSG
jgi:hypothetical protein